MCLCVCVCEFFRDNYCKFVLISGCFSNISALPETKSTFEEFAMQSCSGVFETLKLCRNLGGFTSSIFFKYKLFYCTLFKCGIHTSVIFRQNFLKLLNVNPSQSQKPWFVAKSLFFYYMCMLSLASITT